MSIKSFAKEFKTFAVKGNMVDLAVGVIIGTAFNKIITSIVNDLVMPIVNWLMGGGSNFSNKYIILSKPDNFVMPEQVNYESLTAAGASLFAYGHFFTVLLDFILLALIVFILVRMVNKVRTAMEETNKKEVAAAPPPPTPADILLLEEIRDLLKQKNS